MSDELKAMKYEALKPGVQISSEHKAERYDRMVVKEKYAGLPRRARIQQSVAIIGGNCWCDCGLFKNHEGDCK